MECMSVYVDFEELKTLYDENKKITKEIWKEKYYLKYKKVFDAMLKYLYFTDLDNLLNYVETTNFDKLIKNSDEAIKNGYIPKILSLIDRAKEILNFNEDFDVYFLIGFNHIDGTSLMSDKPFLYFGLERLIDANIKILVPHEFNHLVRNFRYKEFDTKKLKFKDYMIYEGVATYFSIYFNKFDINPKNVALALFIPQEKFEILNKNKDEIRKDIMNLLNIEMDNQIMMNYFTYDGDKKLKQGYYIGLKIIEELVSLGNNIIDLTYMNSDDILNLYFKNQ
ncbi:MAG TPA: DUF2268 domain-containing putative Zn-dependent protease [Caldisericia bacterium]|nr:DUF2268 domain-containing putative Zn-dependent protease [Caldisericia bacterium]